MLPPSRNLASLGRAVTVLVLGTLPLAAMPSGRIFNTSDTKVRMMLVSDPSKGTFELKDNETVKIRDLNTKNAFEWLGKSPVVEGAAVHWWLVGSNGAAGTFEVEQISARKKYPKVTVKAVSKGNDIEFAVETEAKGAGQEEAAWKVVVENKSDLIIKIK